MSLAIAVPFRDGAIVGASAEILRTGLLPEDPARLYTTVVKTPWGLLTGASAAALDRARRALLESPALTVTDIHRELLHLLPPGAQAGLLSYEPEESTESDPRVLQELDAEGRPRSATLGLPVRLYRLAPHDVSWLSWGAVLPPAGISPDCLREGELHLRWHLDKGADFDARLEAVMETFSWFRERLTSLSAEVDLGVHEPGHRFSVDRLRW
jgi:hypothetical protein